MYSYGPHSPYNPTVPRTPTFVEPTLAGNADHEAKFAAGIFDEIWDSDPVDNTPSKGRRSRAKFQWPQPPTQEDRILVVFRCMQRAGFETFGEFFAAVLGEGNNKHRPVFLAVTAFLQCKAVDSRTHPVSIVQRMFDDHRSRKRLDAGDDLRFDLPRYALPPSQRLLPTFPPPLLHHTRNALTNWALQIMVQRWKDEAELLLNPVLGFVREPGAGFSWLDVFKFSMTENQEKIAVNAPVIFTCMTSAAVNERVIKKLDVAAAENTVQEPGDSDDTDDEDARPPPLSTGVPPRMRRDPWLGATVAILMLLVFRYRFAIVFPTFVGLFLFTCNAHRDVFALLSRIGLSVAYRTVLDTLHILAADSSFHLRVIGAVAENSQPILL
ncbi:hypothetical protein C8J57DRAFT_1635896 [Mycena rebaudengoi]|nr:hypothetical protein C8J57DRAFT_1635896 [Mycena rebaudengoi]